MGRYAPHTFLVAFGHLALPSNRFATAFLALAMFSLRTDVQLISKVGFRA